MSKIRFLIALSIFAGLFSVGTHAFAAGKSKKHAKKADASQGVTILDMSGPVEDESAMPVISKKGPL